jgi:DNA-binding beta-propeller fold protein YncE
MMACLSKTLEKRMVRRNTRLWVTTVAALAAALAIATPVHAAGLRQVGTIAILGEPINQFGSLAIDQATGLGYLADKDNSGVVVFDTKTNKFVTRITGFVGMAKDGNKAGPNGLVVVTGGEELWVSDGDSTVKIVDLKTNTITGTISTGGKSRANAMALDPVNRVVIVANSNDDPPYLNLISAQGDHKILAKIPIKDSAENIERSAYHVPSGTFYTVIPVLRGDASKGLLAQTDPRTGKLVQLHQIENCHPHSLSVVSDMTIFMGCSSAHGPSPKPGGDLAIFDIPSGKLEGYGPGLGGNGGSTVDPKLGRYYHATSHGALLVVDTKTRALVQKVETSNGARSLDVNLSTDRVYLATTAKDGGCGGCIVVYAAE